MTLVAKAMREKRVNAVLVENKKINQKGIITERDLLKRIKKGRNKSELLGICKLAFTYSKRNNQFI